MILKRIYVSFFLMAMISLALGAIGWFSTQNASRAVTGIIENDLPAAEQMGAIGRGIMSIQANLNSLLNPGLTLEERETPHKEFAANRQELLEAMSKFDAFVNANAENQELAEVAKAWEALKATQAEWLTITDEIFLNFREWDATFVMNPATQLRDLQQYRGDHYFLVRRLVEMAEKGQVSGPEVLPGDRLCAFGKWHTSFESGKDISSRNPGFQEAMKIMAMPHKQFHATAAEIYNQVKSDPSSSRIPLLMNDLFGEADTVVNTFGMIINEANQANDIYQNASSRVIEELGPKRDTMLAELQALIKAKADYDAVFKEEMRRSGWRNILIMMIAVGVALLMSCLLALFMVSNIKKNLRDIIGSLNADVERLSGMSGGLSDTSASLSSGAAQQAAALTECSSAIEEMNSMTSRNAESAKQVDILMEENNRQVTEGSEAVRRMGEAMDDIKSASEEIARIMKTVEDIAFQTNILALNASVEAARAGEAGAGFAVVADEVRNLAQRTTQASQDTNRLIENTVRKVSVGLSTTKDIQERFVVLTSSIQDSAKMVRDIEGATREQAQGMEQLNISITQIEQVTQDNTNNASKAAEASTELNQRAEHLLEQVDELGRVIGGGVANSVAGGGEATRALPASHESLPMN